MQMITDNLLEQLIYTLSVKCPTSRCSTPRVECMHKWIPDNSGTYMVQTFPIAEWSGFRMAYEYQTKFSPIFRWSSKFWTSFQMVMRQVLLWPFKNRTVWYSNGHFQFSRHNLWLSNNYDYSICDPVLKW